MRADRRFKGDNVMPKHEEAQHSFGTRLMLKVLAALLVVGTSTMATTQTSSAAAAPLLPAKCLPIPGPNHGAGGNQYEVHFRMLRNCDEAVAVFQQIVGQTPPNKPDNSPRLWWDGAGGWKCEAGAGGRQVVATYCESGAKALAFNPLPARLASPATILIGQVPSEADAQIFVEGSSLTDEGCVVPGPAVTANGRTFTKWTLLMKNDARSAVGCSFAEGWLGRLVRQTGRGSTLRLATAPLGWKCYAILGRQKAVAGVCRKDGTTKVYFTWTPAPDNP
jgi:hypothetical protein